MTADKLPTKTACRSYAREASDYLRLLRDELTTTPTDWHKVARLANEASGYAGQIATDIEMAIGPDPTIPDFTATPEGSPA
jgi:hypothetical protein